MQLDSRVCCPISGPAQKAFNFQAGAWQILSDTDSQSLTTGYHRQSALNFPRLSSFTAPGTMRQNETGNADTGRRSPYFRGFQ